MSVYGTIVSVKHFEIHDGPGIRTTLFLKGCPLHCIWCHNPESICSLNQLMFYERQCVFCGRCATICPCHMIVENMHQIDHKNCRACGRCASACPTHALKIAGQYVTAEEIFPELMEDRIFYGKNGGVTLSGGEPMLQADFAISLLQKTKKEGISTAIDTCCYVPWTQFEKVIPYTDVFLVDIKAIDEETHIRLTGVSNRLIMDNIRHLDNNDVRMEIRIPYIPGLNEKEIDKIAIFIRSLKTKPLVKVLPYHDYGKSKYKSLGIPYILSNKNIPDASEIQKVINRMAAYGIHAINGMKL